MSQREKSHLQITAGLAVKQQTGLSWGWRLDCVRRDEAAEQHLNGAEQKHTTGTVESEAQQRRILSAKCAAPSPKSFKDDVSAVNFGQCIFHPLFYGKESKFGMCGNLGCMSR